MLSKQFPYPFSLYGIDSLDRILHREFSHSADANRERQKLILESLASISRRLWPVTCTTRNPCHFSQVWEKGLAVT